MKHRLFRTLAVLLTCAMLFSLCPFPATQAMDTPETNPYWDTVEQQVRAYAKSINISGADTEAAWALAGHGVTGRGRKLNVGADHPLTATLMNGELGLATVIRGCAIAVDIMAQTGRSSVFSDSGCNWSTDGYTYCNTTYLNESTEKEFRLHNSGFTDFEGTANAYDTSLVWMSGSTEVHMYFNRVTTTADTITYQVEVLFEDRFDFSTGTGSVPKELLSLIGSFLFREFDWTATAEFTLTVPNLCSHQSANYHMNYDPENDQLAFNTTDGFLSNDFSKLTYTFSTGKVNTYYRLSRSIRLKHDRPWVLEFTVTDANKFVFAEADSHSTFLPYILHTHNRLLLLIPLSERDSDGNVFTSYYGLRLNSLFSYNATDSYTFHLENMLQDDGSNMIHLSVHNNTLGKTVLEPTPMDNCYHIIDGSYVLQDDQSKALSGLDLTINYLGNINYNFEPPCFEMKVWENGTGNEPASYFKETATTAPTCASHGYSHFVCTWCGYEYDGAYTDPLPHRWGPWSVSRKPTYQEEGEEIHTCTDCGYTESRLIPRLEYIPGDANGDSIINGKDLILLRQHLAGWDVSIHPEAADANGDGTVNGKDLILLRQYLAGWDVSLAE